MSTELTVVQQVRQQLDKREHEFRAQLPAHIPSGQFIRIAQTAMILNEDLQQCTQKSLIIACMKAAEAGLLPDGEEAALVAYNVKVSKKNEPERWEKQAKFMPMVRGIRKQVQQSGMCKDWKVRLVYSKDRFRHIDGDIELLEHEPAYVEGDHPIMVYSIAYLENGELSRHVMRMDAVEKIRKRSRSAEKGSWITDFEEMVKKTCLRQHSKALPRSRDNVAQQRFMGSLRALDDAEAVIEAPVRRLEAPIPSMHEAASQRLADAIEQSDYDPDTGEIAQPPEPEQPDRPKRGRRSAADKLAEVEAGRVQRLREAEERKVALDAAKAHRNGTAKPMEIAEAEIIEPVGTQTLDAREDPAPNGFRDQVEETEAGGEEPEAAAFRDGWNSRFTSKSRTPPRHLDHRDDISAWMKGYDAAQQCVNIGNAPGTPEASKIMCDNQISKMFAS